MTTKALRRYQRQVEAARDAEIYRETGGYSDLEGMHEGTDLARARLMRAIHLALVDKTRPVVVLTRELARDLARDGLSNVTVAPITSTMKGVGTEVRVGSRNGLDHESAISCDNLTTIPVRNLGRRIGFLFDDQEIALAQAMVQAFDLRVELLE